MKLLIKLIRWSGILLVGSCSALAVMSDQFFFHHPPLSVVLITIGVISGLMTFGCLVYHWFRTKFTNKPWKIFWIIAIFFYYPLMIGPALYYLLVVELKKTVANKTNY